MILPTLQPIRDEDLPEFCRFLCENLSRERPAEEWAKAFAQDWCPGKPNNGFLIRHQGRIVGGIGAIYAERPVRGRLERFCNITSWCVLDAFRAQSMRLAMAVAAQPGFHFTDLTPTEVVSKTLQFLKFKPMNERHAIWPNLPWPLVRLGGIRVLSDPAQIGRLLGPDDAKTYRDHRHLPWLRHLAVGMTDAWCYVVWKRTRLKGHHGCHHHRSERCRVVPALPDGARQLPAGAPRSVVYTCGIQVVAAAAGAMHRIVRVSQQSLQERYPDRGGHEQSVFRNWLRLDL